MLSKVISRSFASAVSTSSHRNIVLCSQDMARAYGTRWTDVKLSAAGIQQALKAGKVLSQNGYSFDICFTSTLTRAIQTFNYAAEQLNCHFIPVVKNWRLNQRHYGALQGLNKLETVAKHGKQQVQVWRRSFDIPPPPLQLNDDRHPSKDSRYKQLKSQQLPLTQSLKSTIARVMPYWQQTIVPMIKSGKKVLVVAHGNSLRAIVKSLSNVPEKDIVQLNIPTAIPLVYEFDQKFKVLGYKYLADPEQLEAQINKVKAQTFASKQKK